MLAVADAVRKAAQEDAPAEGPSAGLRADAIGGELLVSAPGSCLAAVWALPDLSRRGTVEACAPDPPPAAEIPRAALERAARLHPSVPARPGRLVVLVDDVVRLSETRVAALLSLRLRVRAGGPDLPGNQQIALFEAGRLVHASSYFRGDLTRLRASPGGAYVTALPGIVLRADGSEVRLPHELARARALAWSPDGRWLALARRGDVLLVETDSLERHDRAGTALRTIALPLVAGELAWR